MFFVLFFFASALSAFHLYNESKFMVIGNPVILEQSHAHNAPDLWDRGSILFRYNFVHYFPDTGDESVRSFRRLHTQRHTLFLDISVGREKS